MKTKVLVLSLISTAALLRSGGAFAQANTSLSNLTSPTAINQSLLVDTDGAYTLGSSTAGLGGVFTASLYTPSIIGSPSAGLSIGTPGDPGDGSGATNISIGAGNGTVVGGGSIYISAGPSSDSGQSGGSVVVSAGGNYSGNGGNVEIKAEIGAIPAQDGHITLLGHLQAAQISGTLSVSSCGTSPSLSSGNDTTGTINVGTGTSTCTLNFAETWTSTPNCFVSDAKAAVAIKVIPSTTSVVFTAGSNFASGTSLSYFCLTTDSSGPLKKR